MIKTVFADINDNPFSLSHYCQRPTVTHRTATFTDSTFPLKELWVLCKHAQHGPALSRDPNRLVCLTSFKISACKQSFKISACKQSSSNRSFKSLMPQGWQLLEMKNGAPSPQILKLSVVKEEKAAIRSSQRPSSTDSMEYPKELTATSGEQKPSCHL